MAGEQGGPRGFRMVEDGADESLPEGTILGRYRIDRDGGRRRAFLELARDHCIDRKHNGGAGLVGRSHNLPGRVG